LAHSRLDLKGDDMRRAKLAYPTASFDISYMP
jgi:hypothetical protein